MSRTARILPLAAALLLNAGAGQASATWHVTHAAPSPGGFLAGLAALPKGREAVLIVQRSHGENRLMLRRTGKSTKTLATSAHTFRTAFGADAHGHVAVAWMANPSSRMQLWTAQGTQALSAQPVRATPAMAVDADGRLVVAYGATDGSAVVFRGTVTGGVGAAETAPGMGGFWVAAVDQAGRAALAGLRVPPGAAQGPLVDALSRAASSTAPFGTPALLPSPSGPQGTTPIASQPALGIVAGGTVVTAVSINHCFVGTTSQCAGSEIQGAVWRNGRAAPDGPVRLSVAPFAYAPRYVASGDHSWLAWQEGANADEPPRVLASARVTSTSFGAVRRLRLIPSNGVQLANYDGAPVVAPAPNGKLRWYLPTISRAPHTLKTVLQSANGTFGKIASVAGSDRFAKPAPSGFVTPAVGIVRDLVGWANYDSAAAAADRQSVWMAEP